MDFLNGKGEGYFPVNYSKIDDKDGSITYISPAVYTKEISVNSIEKIAGEFVPCKEKDICPACDMFGYMGNSNETSRGSRIRFSDLHVTEKGQTIKNIICAVRLRFRHSANLSLEM